MVLGYFRTRSCVFIPFSSELTDEIVQVSLCFPGLHCIFLFLVRSEGLGALRTLIYAEKITKISTL